MPILLLRSRLGGDTSLDEKTFKVGSYDGLSSTAAHSGFFRLIRRENQLFGMGNGEYEWGMSICSNGEKTRK